MLLFISALGYCCGASALVFCSCFHRKNQRDAFLSPTIFQPSSSSYSSSSIFRLFFCRSSLLLPRSSFFSYTPSSSRVLLLSFSPVSLIFLPARSPARRMRTKRGEDEREDEVQSLSSLGLKGADVTYGSRPDCTQLFRRAILMPWTPSANHPLLLLLSYSSSSASSSSSSVSSSSSSSSSSPTPSSSLVDVVVVVGVLVFFMARYAGPSLSRRYERLLSVPIMQ